MVEQWSRVVDSVTRALVLNLFEVDVAPPAEPVCFVFKVHFGSLTRIREIIYDALS